jgi:hypothetical protein
VANPASVAPGLPTSDRTVVVLKNKCPIIAMRPTKESMRAIEMLSFIIPAWNEERMLGQTLPVLEQAARALPMPHETIVVDEASTDRTGRVAREPGAAVLMVHLRQMGCEVSGICSAERLCHPHLIKSHVMPPLPATKCLSRCRRSALPPST